MKLKALLLAAAMLFGLCGCAAAENPPESAQPSSPTQQASENTKSDTQAAASEKEKKILVAYFSCTGNTEKAAKTIAGALGADTWAITPAQPYTDEDLNYNNSSSRSSVEMNDASARPAMADTVTGLDKYDVIFLGYPIWWGQAPRIVDTFLESGDFSGKTIIPFCTSGGSGVGSSADDLHSLCPDSVTWLNGTRLDPGISKSDAVSWINSLGLDIKAE